MDMNIESYGRLLDKYRTTKETAAKVRQIFSQGKSEFSDPEYEAIVAGFMQNSAVAGMFEHVPANSLGLPVLPTDGKSMGVALLTKRGYDIITKDKDIAGEVADFIAKHPQTDEVVVLKCGPAMVKKVLSYLDRPNTSLWILDHNNRLFTFKRGPEWDSFMTFHKEVQNGTEQVEPAPTETVPEPQPEPQESVQEPTEEAPPEEEYPRPEPEEVPEKRPEPAPEEPPEALHEEPKPEPEEEAPSVETADETPSGEEETDSEDDDTDEDEDDGDIRVDAPKSAAFLVGNRKLPRVLTEDEVAEMIRISKPIPRDNLLLQCMYFLGMSNSEVQNLTLQNINFTSGKVSISQGKNRRDRQLPMPEDLRQDLKSFIGARPEGYLIRGRDKKGKRISDRHIRRIVKAYAKEAGVKNYEEIHPHTLRHSYAAHLLNQGTPIETVQGILGHERLETTAIYSQIHNTQKLREHVDDALGN